MTENTKDLSTALEAAQQSLRIASEMLDVEQAKVTKLEADKKYWFEAFISGNEIVGRAAEAVLAEKARVEKLEKALRSILSAAEDTLDGAARLAATLNGKPPFAATAGSALWDIHRKSSEALASLRLTFIDVQMTAGLDSRYK